MTTTQATTATTTRVTSSATNVTLFTADSDVHSRAIYNESTAVLYIKFGATATTTDYKTQISANTLFEFPSPVYAGRVDGFWASANGAAQCTSW